MFAGLSSSSAVQPLLIIEIHRTQMDYPNEKAPQNTHFHIRSHSSKSSAKDAGTCHYSIFKVVSLQLDIKTRCFAQGIFHRAA